MDPSDPDDLDFLQSMWTLNGVRSFSSAGGRALSLPAQHYTLSQIEGDPDDLIIPKPINNIDAYLINWSYPGNVFYNTNARTPLLNRAIMMTAVHLIASADGIDGLTLRKSNALGQLSFMAATYRQFRDDLPPSVSQAFQDGIAYVSDGFAAVPPKAQFGDFLSMRLNGAFEAYLAIGDPVVKARMLNHYITLANDVWPTYFSEPSGMCLDMLTVDRGYVGVCADFLIHLANIEPSQNPFIDDIEEWIADYYELRAHSVMVEPDGGRVSTSAESSRTGQKYNAGKGDEWQSFARELAGTAISDYAWPFLLAVANTDNLLYPTDAKIAQLGQVSVGAINRQAGRARNPAHAFTEVRPWNMRTASTGFPRPPHASAQGIADGTNTRWDDWQDIAINAPELFEYPSEQDIEYTKQFGNQFLYKQTPYYTVGVNFGGRGTRERFNTSNPNRSGLRRGIRSPIMSFHTRDTGTMWNSMRRGYNNATSFVLSTDDNREYYKQPYHGTRFGVEHPDGIAHTESSTIRALTTHVGPGVSRDDVLVKLGGWIPRITNQYGKDDKVLRGEISWYQALLMDDREIKVTTSVGAADPDDLFEAVVESIPIYRGNHVQQALNASSTNGEPLARITAYDVQGNAFLIETAATSDDAFPGPPQTRITYYDEIVRVRVHRFGGAVDIILSEPHRVGFTDPWRRYVGSGAANQQPYLSEIPGVLWAETSTNMLVDLLPGSHTSLRQFEGATLEYRIRPVGAVDCINDGPRIEGPRGSPSCSDLEDNDCDNLSDADDPDCD